MDSKRLLPRHGLDPCVRTGRDMDWAAEDTPLRAQATGPHLSSQDR